MCKFGKNCPFNRYFFKKRPFHRTLQKKNKTPYFAFIIDALCAEIGKISNNNNFVSNCFCLAFV